MKHLYYAIINLILSFFWTGQQSGYASPIQTTHHIKVDQFGYFPSSKKFAIIADPQTGLNGGESFSPGTGAGQYQVRRWNDDVAVFSGTLQAWNSGNTHTQSGDRGWWFDFSAVTTPGSYYIFDLTNNVGSYRFEIGDQVYDEVLKQSIRTFYYQRINFAKQTPYADSRWTDGACFEGSNQDRYATSRYAKGDLSTAKDVHGGWMDAGDKNKYTTFAHSAVIQLLEGYRINPGVFKDNYNIPESGNGIPDLLDEVKWELDFLKRMQDATGTHGFLLKVGNDNYNEVTPPSSDTRPRYYLPECTSATIAGCSMFAVAGVVFSTVPALSAYGQDLITRAEAAWARAKVTTASFTSFQTNCDDGDIKSGDADNTAETQLDNAFVAAVYLYEATQKTEYKTFIEANYSKVNPYKINWWGPYWMPQQLALLRTLSLPGISSTVITNIRNQKANMNYLYSYPTYDAGTDLYKAHMENDAFHWGHNQARSGAGHMNMDFITFNINASNHSKYRNVAEQYVHWLHGANPLGMVMLSNMYGYGAEKSANEIYHTWFTNGSVWDNAITSSKGPAPGYMPGGPNKNYTGTLSYINSEPPQKAYKDWNTEWPENSWEITEPSIYCQASYIMLLARLMSASASTDTSAPTAPANLTVTSSTSTSITLGWNAATDNVGVTAYELYNGANVVNGNISSTSYTVSGLTCATAYSFQVKAKDAAGNISAASNTATGNTASCPTIVTENIYTDVLGTGWSNISAGTNVNLSNSTPVKSGTRSLLANFNGNGTLAFSRTAAVSTTTSTQLRFWVYNNGRNGLKIFTHDQNGVKSNDVFYKPSRAKWVEVIISMSQLGNPASIQKVTIQNNSSTATSMVYDDIRLASVNTNLLLSLARAKHAVSQELHYGLRVYPNPARHQVSLSYTTADNATILVELLDVFGRKLLQRPYVALAGSNNWNLTLPQLPSGTYYIQLIHHGERRVVPLEVR